MACPSIKYGVGSSGANEFQTNTSRELFRCGTGANGCIKMFLTNVSMEGTNVNFGCDAIDDALVTIGDKSICLQTANANARDRTMVNWYAKDNVSSSADAGTVLNYVKACGESGLVYTHTEGSLSFKAMLNVADISTDLTAALRDVCIAKFVKCNADPVITSGLTWIFSDLNTNVSPTDWQGGGGTFQGFGTPNAADFQFESTHSINYNWNNGQAELRNGRVYYDQDPTTLDINTIITNLFASLTAALPAVI